MTQYPLVDHISGNRGPIGSIEEPIDRAHPDAQAVKFRHMSIYFYGCGWPSK
jgi:hypothetical protein